MGSVYRPKYKARDGTIRESRVWWLKYRADGKIIRESSETGKRRMAEKLLKRREGAAEEGRPILPRANRITIRDLAEDLRNDYTANERRSADRLEFSLAHLLPVFGHRRAAHVSTSDVTTYVTKRQGENAANATINRELTALKRMFSLALAGEKLHRAPRIRNLDEHNVRQGFFERDQFEAVRRHLPAYLKPAVTVAYITGWRIRSEILPLQWRQVDFKAGTVRLEPGTTKNPGGADVHHDAGTPGHPRGPAGPDGRPPAHAGPADPVGVPPDPEGEAPRELPPGLEDRLQEGGTPWPDSP